MATRPFVDKSAAPAPAAVNDRLMLAEELLDLAERAQSHTRAAGSAIALQRGDKLYIRTSTGVAPEVGASLSIGEGAIGQCARLGKPCSVSEEGKIDTALRALGVRSLIAVPIHHAGIFYGVLVALGQVPEAFSRMHVAIMMTMGNEIARVLKRMEPAALEIAPGAPLRPSAAAVAPPADDVVTISLTPTAQQNIAETLKTVEQRPVAPPMKLMIDPPMVPKIAPTIETRIPAPPMTPPSPAKPVVASSFIELDGMQPATKPLPDLLVPGEDPRLYGTLKTAKSLEPKPTYTVATAYRPSSSSRMKTPAIAAAVLVIAAAAFGMWRHNKTTAAPHETAAAEPAIVPAPIPVTVPASQVPKAVPVAPATVVVAAKMEAKMEAEKKPVEAKAPETKPAAPQEPALRIATPGRHIETGSAEAPSLMLTANSAMPDLLAPKAPPAKLLVKKTTATPPALLKQVTPIYPDIARRAGTFGDVRLQVTVSPTGKVSNVRVMDGAAILRQAATNAVSQWQYRPATLDGRAVESTVDVVVKFAQR